MEKKKLCLNMIVKNEAHIIKETLESIYKYIDYYIISDTGSTDDTPKVIKQFFDSKNINGEIHHNKWENFGHNRSTALNLCKNKSEYIWVIDADDIIVGDLIIDKNKLTADCYTLIYGSGFTYYRTQIFKNSKEFNWRYVGVLHEYPTCDKKNYTRVHITGNYYIDSRRLGNRSKDPEKYLKDAKTLEEGLKNEQNNERYMFYIAQSYFDYGDIKKGISWYKRRIDAGGWYEEVFYSYYQIANGMEKLKYDWEAIEKAYLDTYNYCPDRAEPLYKIALHYRIEKKFRKAYYYIKKAAQIPFPKKCVLFVFKDFYDYKILDELSICSFYVGNYLESYIICKKLLKTNNTIPENCRNRIKNNLQYAEKKLQTVQKENCIIYVGNKILENDIIFKDLISSLVLYYNIFVVGQNINQYFTNNINFINIQQFQKYYNDLQISSIFLYDNLNFILEQKKYCINNKIFLWQNDEHFKFIIKNGIIVKITNQNILNNLLQYVSKIITYKDSIVNSLIKNYTINSNNIIQINNVNNYSELLNNDINNKINIKIDQFDATNNGFKYKLPKNIKQKMLADDLLNNKIKKDILFHFFNNGIISMPYFPEPLYYLAQYYYKIEEYHNGLKFIKQAFRMINSNNNYEIFKEILTLEKSKFYNKIGKYEKSYNLANKILNNDNIPENSRWFAENCRDINVSKLKNNYLEYPINIIKEIKNTDRPKIVFSITTCKRYNLFQQTMNSFINCCKDINLIDHWLCIDDNSSIEDRTKMKKNYPFFNFVFKNEQQKGHCKSMNIIHEFVSKNKVTYLLHMEDDFHFVTKRNYITDAIIILENNTIDNIGQILFNKNYSEIELYQKRIPGGILRKTTNIRYLIHEHYQPGSTEYNNFINKYKGYGTNAYWPYFSFRPSIIKVQVLDKIGIFANSSHFELQYANEYKSIGYKSAFFDDFCCIHIGKKTWEKDKLNSYELNNVKQFSTNNIPINIIKNQLYGTNNWKKFKLMTNRLIASYNVIIPDSTNYLTSEQQKLFLGNNFNYRRDILNDLLYHIDVWKNGKETIILYDNITFNPDKINKLLTTINDIEFDLIIFNNSETTNNTELELINKIIKPINGYIISTRGTNKLLEFTKNGIQVNLNQFINNFSSNLKIYQTNILLSVTINKSSPTLIVDNYTFYCGMDSFGNDIEYVGDKSIEELKEICSKNDKCVGFNSLGWLKYKIESENKLICLPHYKKLTDGLYVKI